MVVTVRLLQIKHTVTQRESNLMSRDSGDQGKGRKGRIIHTVRHNTKRNSDKKQEELKQEERKEEERGRWKAVIVFWVLCINDTPGICTKT